MMEPEIKALARHALGNAFYEDFSALVNAYVKAGEGLETQPLELWEFLGERANVYSMNDKADSSDMRPNIYFERSSPTNNCGCDSLKEALEESTAQVIWMQGKKLFERRVDGWYYIGGGA